MNKNINLGSVLLGSEAFLLAENFKQNKKSILFIARDDREIFDIVLKLKWLLPKNDLLIYRSWDQIPYDNVSPSKNIQSERIKTLYKLINDKNKKLILTSVNAIVQKTVNKDFIKKNYIKIYTGQKIQFNNLIIRLVSLGYQRTSVVRDKTEFAIRGSIIDIFVVGQKNPIRIDFFDNNIESIYEFDRVTQKRIAKKTNENIYIYISNELLINEDSLKLFRRKFRETFVNYRLSQIYHSFSDNIFPSGGEQFLPLFNESLNTFFDYLNDSTIYLNAQFKELINQRLENINDFYNARKGLKDNYFLNPSYLYLNIEEIFSQLNNYELINLDLFKTYNNKDANIKAISNLSSIRKEIDFKVIKKFIEINIKTKKIIICCRTIGSLERISKIIFENINLKFYKIDNFDEIKDEFSTYTTILDIKDALEFNGHIFITEKTLFGYFFSTINKKNKNKEVFFEEINKLTRGSILVHSDYGLCRFVNIIKIDIGNSSHDCVELEFDNKQKLFLPVENLNNITKYGNDEYNNIKLDKLGSSHWQKRKAEAKNKIKEAAKKLISIAAKRQQSESYPIKYDQSDYFKFSSTFPYVETDDQLSAIQDVISDFMKNSPSDRLIVGDVAFGKTEVIIRALYLAAKSNLQCIVLVPTTLLAKQHFENFSKRFLSFNINVVQISRFITNRDKLTIYEKIKDGSANIIVGTHALLSDKISFKKLGLIIYDEEQKLGTQQKEKLKELAPKAHVISLSATPIPRTLSMSLSGIRDLSLILTAPYDRLSVRTFVSPFDEFTITEAIKREILGRKNGVYFVAPRIKDIPFIEKFLKINLPDIKYVVAHGKLSPKILEERISKFYNNEVPLLVSTNIIENGLDLPHVNTIIIYRANIFSLSGTYQLKGRVGRSSKRGYAYLTFNEKELTENGRKRLNIINSFDQIGSGFNIASQDLDMRGGGSVIGEEQSGFIREIGSELYHQMLEEEILNEKQKLSKDKNTIKKFNYQPNIKIPEKIYIPDTYIDDLDVRMSIYKRISSIDNNENMNILISELLDRFGKLPEPTINLFKLIEIKILCWNNNLELIEFGRKGIIFGFYQNSPKNPKKIMNLSFNKNNQINIRSDQKVFFNFFGELNEDRFELIKRIINNF